jgi:hypothetical protein
MALRSRFWYAKFRASDGSVVMRAQPTAVSVRFEEPRKLDPTADGVRFHEA